MKNTQYQYEKQQGVVLAKPVELKEIIQENKIRIKTSNELLLFIAKKIKP